MSDFAALMTELAPRGVAYRPLRDLGTWSGGGTPSKSRPEYWADGNIPWISPKDMGDPVLKGSQNRITEAAVKSSTTKLLPADVVAVVVRSSILEHTLPIGAESGHESARA